MDADIIDALNTPAYANHEQLEKLNEKLDRVIGLLTAMNGNLTSIKANSRPSGGILGT